jgi:hypothetical protein
MQDRYSRHQTSYVLKYFSHLLSESEVLAISAFVCTVIGDANKGVNHEEIVISIPGIDEPSEEIKLLLSNGMFDLRNRLALKLLNSNKNEIFKNCCSSCEKLPATPLAKQCIWCGYSWRDRKIE